MRPAGDPERARLVGSDMTSAPKNAPHSTFGAPMLPRFRLPLLLYQRPRRGACHMTNSLNPPYTFNKLKAAKRKELVNEIDRQLRLFETSTVSGSDKAVNALNAQFLMQEKTRRDQNWQACIMIVCTIAIAFMTLVLVYFTWRSLSCGH
jgi:hypothetical protein